MEYFECEVPEGDGKCSDDDCPCPEVCIPRGTGYLYITSELVDFRRQYPRLADADKAMEERLRARLEGAGFLVFTATHRTGPLLMCEQGARLRNLDLEVAAADARWWWETGQVPLRPTSTAGGASGDHEPSTPVSEQRRDSQAARPPAAAGTDRPPASDAGGQVEEEWELDYANGTDAAAAPEPRDGTAPAPTPERPRRSWWPPAFILRSRLFAAVRKGDAAAVEYLVRTGADPSGQDGRGDTPLHWCCRKKRADIARFLLEHGARAEVANAARRTPLHEAVENDLDGVVAALLEHGADANRVDEEGHPPLHRAARFPYRTALCGLLLERGADANAKDGSGDTVLHNLAWSAEVLQASVAVEFIKKAGARGLQQATALMTPDATAETAQKLGWQWRNLAVFAMKYGADPNVPNGRGETPLHTAAATGDLGMVQLFVERGADVEVRDDRGRTPLERATEKGHAKVEAFLRTRES